MNASSVAKFKIAVIGGGVIGLSCAWRLAARGFDVALYERDLIGRGASWVAGGMLAAAMESDEAAPPLRDLMFESLDLWPAFAAALEETAGVAVGLRREGTLLVSQDRDALRAQFEGNPQKRVWLDGEALRAREPHLKAAAALYAPGDFQVDSQLVVKALAQACAAAGASVYEYAPVSEVAMKEGRAAGVLVDGAPMPADLVVIANGAWAAALGLAPFSHIAPVKGQILALAMDPAAPLLRHVVWGEGVYLIPRNDGRLIVGASVEPEAGFDARLSPSVLEGLRAAAARILPSTEHLPLVEKGCGFRPGPAHSMPVIGATGIPGVLGAAGHYRNGILLAPVTARHIVEAVLAGRGN